MRAAKPRREMMGKSGLLLLYGNGPNGGEYSGSEAKKRYLESAQVLSCEP